MRLFRLHFAFSLLALWAVVLVGRLFSLQVHDYGTFAAFARGQQQVVEDLDPERGRVLGSSRGGETVPLATNRDWKKLSAIPKDIQDVEGTSTFLRDLLGLDVAAFTDLQTRLGREDDPYEPIADRLTDEQVARIREAATPGLFLSDARGRFYPLGVRLAHVLGFVGHTDDGEERGVYGIEAKLESALRGVSGELRGERDGRGTILEAFSQEAHPPQPGADVFLTIDVNIQYQAERALREIVDQFDAAGGTVVVMEPRTGFIRALANEPTFDPNEYGKVEDLGAFMNPAISAAYEPGSVFKAVTMAAALDSGAVTPETTYENTGSVRIGGYTVTNTLQQYNGERTMVDVLRYSLNTGAVFAAEQAGQGAFRAYVNAFGFGTATGIMLPNEAGGSLTNLETGRPINYATAAFGQGISVTPLQLVSALGAIANGGTLMKPVLVEAIEYPNGAGEEFRSEPVRRVIQQRTATRLAAMMTRVVEDGSGIRAKIPGYTVAGKTGTAEIPNVGTPGYGQDTIHTFVGFFPAFDARYVILTKVDRPKARYAESTAVPLFRRLAEYLITYAAIPPDQPVE